MVFIFAYFFFKSLSLSSLVPVANIDPPNKLNFSTKEYPIPPVAPVIYIFLFLKSIIKIQFC